MAEQDQNWSVWANHVLKTLERLEGEINKIKEAIAKLESDHSKQTVAVVEEFKKDLDNTRDLFLTQLSASLEKTSKDLSEREENCMKGRAQEDKNVAVAMAELRKDVSTRATVISAVSGVVAIIVLVLIAVFQKKIFGT